LSVAFAVQLWQVGLSAGHALLAKAVVLQRKVDNVAAGGRR
jgi:hypothetical protein